MTGDQARLQALHAAMLADVVSLDSLASSLAATVERLADGHSCAPEVAAFIALKMHGYYCATESILERAARHLDGSVAQGDGFHHKLLTQMAQPKPPARPWALSPQNVAALEPLRRFRHFLRHAYAVELDANQMAPLVVSVGEPE